MSQQPQRASSNKGHQIWLTEHLVTQIVGSEGAIPYENNGLDAIDLILGIWNMASDRYKSRINEFRPIGNTRGLKYLKQKFRKISKANIKGGIFVDPQMHDENFEELLNPLEIAW